ncbi:MAG: molybdopterin-dependent oxidoreductase [Proteobacteria bacterium]|nr:molybdopterin-dependent oxidoreductase [Pseudomonadota bacterium]MBI3495935.1 molybdopterin-dependent oxidoreductase [Pseudomonadota bacterium]
MTSLSSHLGRTLRIAAGLLVMLGAALAASLPQPQGKAFLEISGMIGNTNAGDKAVFDLAMLEGFGVTKVQTSTPWTDGRPTFEGVLMRVLLEQVGAKGSTLTAVALNDYKVDVPIADFSQYPVILAYKMDGQELKVRDKGPLWIIYPQDDFPDLKNKQTQAKWVWQIKELRIK